MKKMITFITSTIVVFTTTTTALSMEFTSEEARRAHDARIKKRFDETWEAFRQDPTNDEALKKVIRLKYTLHIGTRPRDLVEGMRMRAERSTDDDEILLQQEIQVMESMVREAVIVMEKSATNRECASELFDFIYCITMLAAIPDYDIHSLLKDFFQNNNERVRANALASYVEAKNVEAIPFLRELIEEANISERNRLEVYSRLENSFHDLKLQGKHDDVAKINAFLNKVRAEEQAKKEAGQTQEGTQTNPIIKLTNNVEMSTDVIVANNLFPSVITNTTDETEQSSQELPPQQTEKSSSNKTILWFFLVILFTIIGGVVAWKKNH